jgi:hypothetical protein
VVVIADPPNEVRLRELTEQVRSVQSQIARLQAESVRLVAELDALPAPDTMTTSAWLAWAAGLTTGEARRQVSLARRLPELPALSDAMASGAISEGVAATLVKVATPANEAVLLDTAKAATGPQLARLVAEYRPIQPAAAVMGRDPAGTFYLAHVDDHGMYDAHLRARADQGTQIDAALRSILEADRADRGEADRADGEARMTRLDALVALAQDHLAGRASAPHVLPQRFQAIVRVDEAVLHPDRDDPDHPGDACLAGVTSLDPATARRLTCDAGIAALVERHGEAIAATAPQRFATPAQVVALHARDKTCQYPGCGRRFRLIAHHVTPHPVGPTRVDELVLLCEQHHVAVHRHGWSTRWHRRRERRVLAVIQPDGTAVEPPEPPTGPPPEPPPPGPRLTGTCEPLTFYARDVIIEHWLTTDQRALDAATATASA